MVLNFVIEKRQAHKAVVNGRDVIIFSSNDYLGLSAHPKVIEAALAAARDLGLGTGGAPGTTGTTVAHEELKAAIAAFESREMAILFPSGYQANQAIHHALDSERTVFYLDNRHHPSALDGARLAKTSRLTRFDHNDLDSLRGALLAHRGMNNVVPIPSVFTVDGDIAPLDRIAALKKELDFILILDEAHATGCLGRGGHGLEEHFGLVGAADFIMGTFSKALGSQGGFIACNGDAMKRLKGEFRAREYSTSLSAVSVVAAREAIMLVETDTSLMESLRRAKALIIELCGKGEIPLIYKESMVMLLPHDNCESLQEKLFNDGYLTIIVHARFGGESIPCLRLIPMATHSDGDIKGFLGAVKKHIR